MGNSIAYDLDSDDEELDDEIRLTLQSGALGEQITHALGSMMSQLVGSIERPTTEMPVIRKKPDLRTFRYTQMYKEIKALCALPANSKRPSERWSLTRTLQKQESGFGPQHSGVLSPNLQRRIANLYIPNQRDDRLMSLEAKVFLCKFNKDGSRLITACQDSMIRISDSSKGTYHLKNRIKAKDINWSILDIDFSPCGQFFTYSTWSDYFFVLPVHGTADDCQWIDLNTDHHRPGIFSIRFSPCGAKIIGGCNNSCIYMADRETRNVHTIRVERATNTPVDINAVSYVTDNDPRTFVSGCANGIVKLWDVRSLGRGRTPVGQFMGHLDGITYIDPRNDGNYILTNSKDQSIKIWDLRKPTPSNKANKRHNLPLLTWDYRWDSVPREYYNPSTTLDGDVSVMTYRGHRVTKSLLRAKFSPALQTGQRYIYTGCGTGRIIVYDVLTGQIKEAIESHKDIVRDLSWHPVRSEIVSSSWDSHVNLNIYKRNLCLKRASSEHHVGPVRRSRRLAHRNGELDADDEEEEEETRQW